LVRADDLHVVGIPVPPPETGAVRIMDSSAVLPFPITLEGFQTKPRPDRGLRLGFEDFQSNTGGLLHRLEALAVPLQ